MFTLLLLLGTYDQIFSYIKITDASVTDDQIDNSLVEYCYKGYKYQYCIDLSDSVDLDRLSNE